MTVTKYYKIDIFYFYLLFYKFYRYFHERNLYQKQFFHSHLPEKISKILSGRKNFFLFSRPLDENIQIDKKIIIKYDEIK